MPAPQKVEKEAGAYKKLGDVELTTRRMFQDGDIKILETIGGDYVLPNGKPLEDIELINIIPEPHKAKALAWFNAQHEAAEHICKVCGKPCKSELGLQSHMKSHEAKGAE